MKLSLDCLTLTDTEPVDVIRAAGAAGFDLVSLWANSPAAFPRALLKARDVAECRAALAGEGVALHSIEAFDLASEERVRGYAAAFETGAQLGAKAALVYNGANGDRAEVVDLLALFAELAAGFGIATLLEPVALAQTRTPGEAARLIADAGAEVGILFDSLHFVRSGSTIADLEALPPGLIRYVQLNDGPSQRAPDRLQAEAMAERLYPGKGAFPLAALAGRLPRDVPWAVEAPKLARLRAGVSATEQALDAMTALRLVL